MNKFSFEHLPSELSTVHLCLFENVENAAALRERLTAASKLPGEQGDKERALVDFAFLDASRICSQAHILTAVHQSLLSAASGSLRTPTTHSEIIWNLSPSTNIVESYKIFGISSKTRTMLLVHVGNSSAADLMNRIQPLIEGSPMPLENLGQDVDWTTLKKHYKMNNDEAIYNSKGAENTKRQQEWAEKVIVGTVCLKASLL